MSDEKQITILLVEDEAVTALAEKRTLEKHGYNVITEMTGEAAIEAVEANPGIDLVLMDINLGSGIDGTRAAELILEKRDLPLVFLSSHTEREVVEKTEGITSYGYIVKNSGETVLVASIKMAFKLFRANRELLREAREHQLSKNLLEDRESKFSEIYDSSPIGIELYDSSGFLLDCNRACLNIFGVSDSEQIKGFRLFEDPNIDDELKEQIKKGGNVFYEAPFDFEKVKKYNLYQTNKSGMIYLYIIISSIKTGNKVVNYIVQVQDITERKLAEKALSESREHYRLVSELVSDYAFKLGVAADGKVTMDFVSDNFYHLTGRRREDAMTVESWSGIIHPDDMAMAMKNLSALVSTRQTVNIECRSFIHDHKMRWINISAKSEWDEREKRVTAIVGAVKDITDRKQAEELKDKREDFIKLISEVATDYIYSIRVQPDGTFVRDFSIGDLSGLLGYQPEGKNIVDEWAGLIIPEDTALFHEKIKSLLDGEKNKFEIRIRTKNNELKYLQEYMVPIRDENENRVAFILGALQDITERKLAEDEVRRLLQEKTILLKEVHHRIKNNISSIESLLSIQSTLINNPELLPHFKDAISRVQTMRVLYDNLLMTDNYVDVSCKNYFDRLIDTVVAIYPNVEKITIEKNITDFIINTRILTPLGIITNELVTNAIKYAFEGRDSGNLLVSISKSGDKISVVIEDNGIGISSDIDFEGKKGFGYMLVDMLVKQLGGSLTITGGKGTRCLVECGMK